MELGSHEAIPLSVLVVEDNLDDSKLVGHFLSMSASERPLNIVNSQYLREAEQVLNNQKIDIVLLDLHLPDASGRKLVRKLCTQFPKIPIVAMTGAHESDQTTELLLEGAQDYIEKDNMDGASLNRSIQYALNRQKLASELQEQKDELSISNAELATISEMACNDLATPIHRLRSFTEQLEESLIRARKAADPEVLGANDRRIELLRELSQQMPDAISMIKESLNDMNRLSNGIRTLSHLDNRVLQLEEVDCHTLAQKIIQANQVYIDANDVEVDLKPLDSVVADPQSLTDILQGIFDNALKYLDPSRPGKISLSSHRDLTYTTFMIRDNGRGMTTEEQSRVFEVFQRGNDVINISGDGMGMPYVRALVRRHRGICWFESKQGQGTVFYFTVDNNLTPVDPQSRPSCDHHYR